MVTAAHLHLALRHPVRFEIGETAAASRFVFATPDGDVVATANEAVGSLSGGIRALNADPSVRAWATPAIHALRLMASGSLADPAAPDRQRVMDAGRTLDPDPARGQLIARSFLEALLADAPEVASRPQGSERDRTTLRSTKQVTPRTFTYRFAIDFLPEPDGEFIARGRLLITPTERGWREQPVSNLWTRDQHDFGDEGRDRVMHMLERLETVWPAARRIIASPARDHVELTKDELGELATSRLSVSLLANRITISWPDGAQRGLSAVAVVAGPDLPPRSPDLADEPDRRLFGAEQGFRVSWKFSVGGHQLTSAELEDLVDSTSGLVRLRDQWVLVDRLPVRRALVADEQELSAFDALRAGLTGHLDLDGQIVEVDTEGWLDDVRQRLTERSGSSDAFVPPQGLSGTLRDYQVEGVSWMAQLHELGLGGILADDMGLGKTFMLIALHVHVGLDSPTLVVCPASVMATWEREIAKFAPGQPVHRFHGPGRHLTGVSSGFVVTTYATMRQSIAELEALDWGLVVADEAQHVKNPRTGAAQAMRRLHGHTRMALTGTPVENNLAELWSILDWTTPGLLGSRDHFRRMWANPIERHQDDDTAKDLSTLIRPFLLRRRKSDPGIAPELPPKIETDHLVQLTREQIGLYESVTRAAMAEIENSSGMKRRGLIITLLTQLKQICNHPAHFLKEPEGKIGGRSAKLAALDDLLEEILAEDSAALLFTQYTQMGHLLARHFTTHGVDHRFLHGGTPVAARETMVSDFQDGKFGVFILSLKAAGTGLNLTQAGHVIHFDRWWNPAVEDQATDRAHRIGQTQVVQVHRLIAEGTIEESIAELIAAKRSLADAVVNAGEAALTELTDTELERLVALRR